MNVTRSTKQNITESRLLGILFHQIIFCELRQKRPVPDKLNPQSFLTWKVKKSITRQEYVMF